jgi:hypothetical protein
MMRTPRKVGIDPIGVIIERIGVNVLKDHFAILNAVEGCRDAPVFRCDPISVCIQRFAPFQGGDIID